MSERLTASVVGGGMGGTLSMRALVASERFQLAAAADVRPEVCEALKEEFPGIRTFASHTEMFAATPTDIVCVAGVSNAAVPSARACASGSPLIRATTESRMAHFLSLLTFLALFSPRM